MKTLYKEDFEKIIVGSSFFGGGGGGSAEEGYKLLEEMLKVDPNAHVDMYSVYEMEDDPNIVSTMVAALGSPVATKGRTFQDEATNAVAGMAKEAEAQGKTLKYVYSGEQGGGNTMLPIYAAWRNKLPILDTDGNGRAVPELNTGLLPVHGIPTSPVVLASEKGDIIVGSTEDPTDGKACETIARYMCQAYDQGIGFAAWMMNKQDHLNASAIRQMTRTMEVGNIMMNNNIEMAYEKLRHYFNSAGMWSDIHISHDYITDISVTSAGGFDTGVTTIALHELHDKEIKIVFQNENLFVRWPDNVVTETVPNIITILHEMDNDRIRAVSNSETKVGMKVGMITVKADPRWYDKPECYGCWEDTLVSAGYRTVGEEVTL